MSSILRFKYPALLGSVAVIAILEIAAHILPLEYTSGAGIFLTEKRRALIEASSPEYDYIILGDSRSLSLNGHARTDKEPYTVYNLSIPAMGPRYFQYYLEKYLHNRKHKPAAVVFAGDPGLFQRSWYTPNHDSKMIYADSVEEGLGPYLWSRFHKRIQYLKAGKYPDQRDQFGAMVWEVFSHRYLHLFSVSDMMEQYTGAERIFMLRESIPNAFYLYRYRDGIKQYTFDLRANSFRKHELPDFCNACSGLVRAECHPDYSRVEDNQKLDALIEKNYGGVNLGDRLDPAQRFNYYQMRDTAVEHQVDWFSREEPEMKPVEDLIRTAARHDIKIVFSDVPAVEPMRTVRYHKIYFERLAQIVSKYPGARIVRFPDPYYPVKLFIEQVHYECEGAARLNQEFYSSVMPEVVKFAPRSAP